LIEYISFGTSARVTSQNGTNNDSSRSHAILQIALKRKNKLHGKISFIDLAGS
jgi:kinesin family protein 2/24